MNTTLTAFAGFLSSIAAIDEQRSLYSLYSDLFKSYEGIRPRWAYDWSIDRLASAIDALDAQVDEYDHEESCELCYRGDTCRAKMPTTGDGWAFQATV